MSPIKSWFAAQAISSIRRGIGSRLAYAIVQRMMIRAYEVQERWATVPSRRSSPHAAR